MQSTEINSTEIFFKGTGNKNKPVIVWAHGWGRDHTAFLPVVTSLENVGHHFIVDLPGFGKSTPPPHAWDTADYADAMAAFIKKAADKPVIWVGHSFGCRIGLQIAARHPDRVKGMILIAAAGLKRYRPWHRKALYMKFRIFLYKLLRTLIPLGLNEDRLRKRFGSADYINAGSMRDILLKAVNEDLTEIARTVACPVLLIYGTKDTETPIEIGARLNKLITGSQMVSLDGLDHYSVLNEGRHRVTPLIKKFIEDLSAKP